MAITDIISEEIETRDPNLEVARASPEDFMTDDEMDPYQDPEFQQLLESLPGDQAAVLMQLIKEFKMAVAQGFEGEFEDFVKMKMSTAQGGPEEFMSEEEMQIGPEEQQSLIPMGQQVAQGGRIGYAEGTDRGPLYIDPEIRDIPLTEFEKDLRWTGKEQRTDMYYDMLRRLEGMSDKEKKEFLHYGAMPHGSGWGEKVRELEYTDDPVSEEFYETGEHFNKGGRIGYQNAGPVGGGIMDVAVEEQVERGPTNQEIIMKWLNDRGLPITPENIQRAIMELSREGQGPSMPRGQMDIPPMEQPRPPTGALPPGVIGEDISETVTPDIAQIIPRAKPEEAETMQIDDDKQDWLERGERLKSARRGLAPDSYLYFEGEWQKEGVNKGWVSQDEYLKDWQMPFFGGRGERKTEEIDRYRDYAQGGRARYGLGSLVKGIFKGVKSLTKSVKKFAKSPLGKMALGYLATAGMANILQPGAASWASPFTKGAGTGWLRPGTVLSNLGKSYTNLFKGADKVTAASDALTSGSIASGPVTADAATNFVSKLSQASENALAAKNAGSGILSGIWKGLKNPMVNIPLTAAAAGLYTAKNPGKDDLEAMMRNYKGEVADWDKMIADIRAGRGPTTPFSTENITYPYPDYMNVADGGRIGRAEGGLMDLGGMEKDYRQEGGFVPLGGKEKADDVPARLSRNEFVFTADAVRNAGGGDVDRGSEVMQNIMTNLEKGGNISEESQGLEGARDMFEVSERLSEVV
jgi:hypothetical protein